MKRNKPVKIKRYKNSFTNSDEKRRKALKWLCFVLVLAVLFLGGFFFAKPIIDAASGFWYSVVNPKDKPDEAVSSSLPVSSGGQSGDNADISNTEIQPSGEDFSQNANWQFVSLSSLSTEQDIQAAARQLKENGISYALITLKDKSGTVYYQSDVPFAGSAISDTAFSAEKVVEIFNREGVQPVAYITAYQDPAAAYADRDCAVKYMSEDTMWLDSSLELGGKPWLNPYSEKARQYIGDLTDEAMQMGFAGVVISKLQFPSGYGTESCYYSGADGRTKSQVLADTVSYLQQIAQNNKAFIWFEIPASLVLGYEVNTYGEQPLGLGMDNIIVRVQLSRLEDGSTYTGGIAAEQLEELYNTASTNGTLHFGVYVADSTLDSEKANEIYTGCENGYTQKIYV